MTGSPTTALTRLSSPLERVADGGEVQLWSAWVDRAENHAASLALLGDDERARAERFKFLLDRDRFVARHAFVRRVLAGCLGVEPAAVGIRITDRGRPELDPPCGIFFNTSHSDGLAVLAVTRGRRVGVDIERVRHIDDAMILAESHFTEREMEFLRSAPQASRSEIFLTLWTRKESFVKAVGGGLSIPLNGFDSMSVGDDGVGRHRGPFGGLPFAFVGLDGPDDYVGAVTIEGTQVALRNMGQERVAT